MGIIQTDHSHIACDLVSGVVTLEQLIQDLKCEVYTPMYRMKVMDCISLCRKAGLKALPVLNIIINSPKELKSVREAAEKTIESLTQ